MTVGGVMLTLLPVCCLLSGGSLAAPLSIDPIQSVKTFRDVGAISTSLLDRSSGMLYLGARDAILAVNTSNLNQEPAKVVWNVPEDKRKSCVAKGKTELDCNNYIRLLEFLGDGRIYVCGTYAFDPHCATLNTSPLGLEEDNGGVKMESGKGKCPFEPSQHYTAVMAGGVLYTAATSNFLGTLFDISRATGPEHERIRTEQSSNWLNDPEFVSSAFIEQSVDNNPTGDDDKIYFFFTEVAKEYDLYTKVKVPRVARVCKSDVGGMKTLQRRWTTFLKAQLVCEDKPSGQRYNVLTDVFTMQHMPGEPGSTHFYGLFTSQWEREDLSAVCVFSLSDINKVLDGPFKELKKTCENWPNPVPTPRPGQCLNNNLKADGFESSLKLPDKVLTFVRDHPLMENSVTAAPLLVRKGLRYTKLAVNLRGRGAVLHLGTDRGELHQVAVVGQNATLLRELEMFSSQESVNNILLYQGQALVGSPSSLARVQADGCKAYRSCEVCARARGLGCVWDTKTETCGHTPDDPGSGDVVNAALKKCPTREERCKPVPKVLRVYEGLRLLLPCVQLSPQPCRWEHPEHRLTRQRHSDLEVTVTSKTLGKYVCTCQESGPDFRDSSSCHRAAYELTLDDPATGGNVAPAERCHVVAGYILCFLAGLVLALLLLFFGKRCLVSHRRRDQPDNSLSSEKGRGLLGSSATPQSPSSASLFSEGFRMMEKRNGTATSNTTTTLLSSQGNGGHHDSSCLINSNSSNGHNNSLYANCNTGSSGQSSNGHNNSLYANCNTGSSGQSSNGHNNSLYANCNTGSSGQELGPEILDAEMLNGRTGERERARPEGVERESGEGDEVDKGLRDGFGEFAVPIFKSQAPMAKCEESSI